MNRRPVILEIFPGISLLGRAFEEVWPEACLVRGPDLIFGGNILSFHTPPGVFSGILGGPPCQLWARTRTFHGGTPENLIPEYERVVTEAAPEWWLMENVPGAPIPAVAGYITRDELIRDVWVGGETTRLRRFSFGTRDGLALVWEHAALHRPDPAPTVISGGATRRRDGSRYRDGRQYGAKTRWAFERAKVDQGLPADFDLPMFTVAGKIHVVGAGVPMALGRTVARAVKRALDSAPGGREGT